MRAPQCAFCGRELTRGVKDAIIKFELVLNVVYFLMKRGCEEDNRDIKGIET
jgi:hypothetical protein